MNLTSAATPEVYWWRLQDNEVMLMSLKPAELKCYMVVARAIQRDLNEGKISVSQVSKRAKVSRKTAQQALASVVAQGCLTCEKRAGATAVYGLPFSWVQRDKWTPVGDRVKGQEITIAGQNQSPTGDQHRSPTGDQNPSPTSDAHLELSELSEQTADFTQQPKQHHSGSSSENDAVNSAFEEVEAALCARACIRYVRTEADKAVIRRLLAGGASVQIIQRAILLGCSRKLKALINNGTGSLIKSVNYFTEIIGEVKGMDSGSGYWQHLEYWIQRHEKQWVTSRKSAGRCERPPTEVPHVSVLL